MNAHVGQEGTSAPALGVLAEDLQGALASASRLQQRGLRVVVVTSRSQPLGDVDAVIVDLGLRRRLEDPRIVSAEWTRWLLSLGAARIEARLDPLLHGSPAEIVRGARQTVGSDATVWVIASYPSAGREMLGGRLLSTDASGMSAELDVRRALELDDAVVIPLETVTAGPQALLDAVREHSAAGAGAFLFDATTASHLEAIAAAAGLARDEGMRIVSATSGAWLRHFPDLDRDGFVLLAAAGSNAVDRLQLSRVSDTHGGVAIALSVEEARSSSPEHLRRLFSRHRIVIVQARDRAHDNAAAVAADIGVAVRRLLDTSLTGSHPCLGIITSGGLTTSEVLAGLSADALLPGNELEPLCPVVRLSGGPFDRLAVISKSGSIGTSETFVRLLRRLVGV